MKNKGRRHKAGRNGELAGMSNCKGSVAHVTRPITSMSSKGFAGSKFDKKKWIKRIRGYFKGNNSEKLD